MTDPVADRVVRLVSWVGAAAGASAAALWVVAPGTPGLDLLALAGLVGVGGRIAFDLPRLRERARDPHTRRRWGAAARALGVVGLAVAVFVAAERSPLRADATVEQTFGPSAAAQALASDLRAAGVEPTALSVRGWYLAHGDAIHALQRRRFERIAGSLRAAGFAPELRDPARDAAGAEADGIRGSGWVVVAHEGAVERLNRPDEAEVLGAARRLALGAASRVLFTRGGGEPEAGRGTDGLTGLAGVLRGAGFSTEARSTLAAEASGGPDVIAIVGRREPLEPEDIDLLSAHLDGGGGVLLALDPGAGADLVGRWGLVGGDPLVDPAARDPSRPLLLGAGPHPLGLATEVGVKVRTACEARPGPDGYVVLRTDDGAPGAVVVELSRGRLVYTCDSDWLRDGLVERVGNREFAVRVFRLLAAADPEETPDPGPPAPRAVPDDRVARVAAVVLLPGVAFLLAVALRRRR